MIWPLIYGGNVSKNARPIELHWVTCRYATYLWAERSLGKFIVRPFGYVWFWKIVAVRNYDPTHAPRVLARARRPYLFAPRVLSGNHLLSLSFFLILFFRRSDHIISLSLSLFLCRTWTWCSRFSDAPAFRQNMRPVETTLYNIMADTYRYAFLSDKSRTNRGNVRNFGANARRRDANLRWLQLGHALIYICSWTCTSRAFSFHQKYWYVIIASVRQEIDICKIFLDIYVFILIVTVYNFNPGKDRTNLLCYNII